MDLTWWQLLIIVVAAITTLRIAANFDVAAILENRRRHRRKSLHALCPHAMWEMDGDQIVFRILVVKPPGTIQAYCMQCGLVFPSYHSAVEAIGHMWKGREPKELLKAQKKFLKRANRHYGL